MNRTIAIILFACLLAGCQKGITKQQVQCVRKAIVTQQGFHAKRGAELQRQYEQAKKEYPVLARYVALQEVSFGVLATGYETHIRDLCITGSWHLSAAGKSYWQARCDQRILMPPPKECIFECLECIGQLKPDDCADLCNCGGGPDD
jgi:hypothetical protein